MAQAGRKGAITVSTNMAGRGTDIMLGGNPEMIARLELKNKGVSPDDEPEAFAELVEKHEARVQAIEHDEVVELGGLHIIGTERHESRRIDNQLRGRAGRQGDPGYSKFYLSLEDDLMRIFAGDRVKNLMDRMGMPDDEPIEHPLGHAQHRERAAQGRGAQLRHPQEPARVRRRDERAAQDGLRAAPAAARSAATRRKRSTRPARPRASPARSRSIPRSRKTSPGPSAQLVGMFCDPPLGAVKENGKPRYPTREELEKAEKLVELEALQHEVYQLWGVKLDIEGRKKRTPVSVYDELVELVPAGLSEQRERVLDL